MDIIFKEINNNKEELLLINQKINGTTFLEILNLKN